LLLFQQSIQPVNAFVRLLNFSSSISFFEEKTMRSINHTHAVSTRIRVALVASALFIALGSSAQSAFAGPVAPPPGKSAAKSCIKNGKLGIKTPKACVVKLGPVAPPPGM